MKRVIFYFFYDSQGIVDDYIIYKLSALREFSDNIFVVSNSPLTSESRKKLETVADTVYCRDNIGFDVWAYKEAMEVFGRENLQEYDELILMNNTFFGPIYPFSELFEKMDSSKCSFWGVTAHDAVEFSFAGVPLPFHIQSHWIAVRKDLFTSLEYERYWDNMPMINSYTESIVQHESKFTQNFSDKGFQYEVYIDNKKYDSLYPALFSIEETLQDRCPIFKKRAAFHPPWGMDRFCSNVRAAIDHIDKKTSYDIALIWKSITRNSEPRNLYTNLNMMDFFSHHEEKVMGNPKVAVLAHMYYADMFDEMMSYAENIPVSYDLIITTGSEDAKTEIEKRLQDHFEKSKELSHIRSSTVMAVEQNRGRDMSSLVISCKEIVLDGGYDYICRIHSKKSPQVGRNQSTHFKSQMYDNLLPSRGFVSQILNSFQSNPTLGMYIPPIVQFGYGTLGHSWFVNKNNVQKLADKIDVHVPFDEHTPLAAYGTMFWFRPCALKKLFNNNWQWSDFDKEPHHVDGSMAHAIERILAYTALDAGYQVRGILSPGSAALNYTKLEYKLANLLAVQPNGYFYDQLNNTRYVFAGTNNANPMVPGIDPALNNINFRQMLALMGRRFFWNPFSTSHPTIANIMKPPVLLARKAYRAIFH